MANTAGSSHIRAAVTAVRDAERLMGVADARLTAALTVSGGKDPQNKIYHVRSGIESAKIALRSLSRRMQKL